MLWYKLSSNFLECFYTNFVTSFLKFNILSGDTMIKKSASSKTIPPYLERNIKWINRINKWNYNVNWNDRLFKWYIMKKPAFI